MGEGEARGCGSSCCWRGGSGGAGPRNDRNASASWCESATPTQCCSSRPCTQCNYYAANGDWFGRIRLVHRPTGCTPDGQSDMRPRSISAPSSRPM